MPVSTNVFLPKAIAIVCQWVDFDWDSTRYDMIIGVEKGCLWLMDQNLPLDYAIGDFDSVSQEEQQAILQYAKAYAIYPIRKDFLDGELALQYARHIAPKGRIEIIAGGGNWDMMLAMAGLLDRYQAQLINAFNHIQIASRGALSLKPICGFETLSFMALEPSCISIQGLAYEAKALELSVLGTQAIRNHFTNTTKQALLQVHYGKVLVLHS